MSQPNSFNFESTPLFQAVRHPDSAINSVGRQGWEQFLAWKCELLDAYDRARQYARTHEVETYHGLVAEAHFRSWLGEFLPKKFGVTAGYIVSQGIPAGEPTPAFDVIVYDQLESPVLWAEGHPDRSPQGKMRAIPAEHVRAVFEVKAALTTTSAKQAAQHLADLLPILGKDESEATHKCNLPPGFSSWTIFFELRKADEKSFTALDHLATAAQLRGYTGGFVMRGDGLEREMSGEIGHGWISNSSPSLPSAASLLQGSCFSNWLALPESKGFAQITLSWSRAYFSTWPFYLLRCLNGQYDTRSVPSWYGFPPIGNQISPG